LEALAVCLLSVCLLSRLESIRAFLLVEFEIRQLVHVQLKIGGACVFKDDRIVSKRHRRRRRDNCIGSHCERQTGNTGQLSLEA
jgi:hypothetical protein